MSVERNGKNWLLLFKENYTLEEMQLSIITNYEDKFLCFSKSLVKNWDVPRFLE